LADIGAYPVTVTIENDAGSVIADMTINMNVLPKEIRSCPAPTTWDVNVPLEGLSATFTIPGDPATLDLDPFSAVPGMSSTINADGSFTLSFEFETAVPGQTIVMYTYDKEKEGNVEKPMTINVVLMNFAPEMPDVPLQIVVPTIYLCALSGKEQFTYTSPIAVDGEGDSISMDFGIEDKFIFMEQNSNDSFSLSLPLGLQVDDSGTYQVSVTLTDDASILFTEHVIDIVLEIYESVDCTEWISPIDPPPEDLKLRFDREAAPSAAITGMDYFFTNEHPACCPLTTCSLLEAGCSTPLRTNFLKVAPESPFGVTALLDHKEGYNHTFCFSCEHADGAVQFDGYSVTQVKDCANTLKSYRKVEDQVVHFDYEQAPVPHKVGDSTTFFLNQDPKECPVESCQLMQEGCREALNSTELRVSPEFPFLITAKNGLRDGFNESFCVECTNGADTVTYDEFSFTQIRDCSSKVTLNKTLEIEALSFEKVNATTVLGDYSLFFKNIAPESCLAESCQILEPGCGDLYDTDQLSFSEESPFDFTASIGVS